MLVLMVERGAPELKEQAWLPVVRVWLVVLAELHSSSAQQAFRAQERAADDWAVRERSLAWAQERARESRERSVCLQGLAAPPQPRPVFRD